MSEPKGSEGVNDALTALYNKAYRLGQERMRERCAKECNELAELNRAKETDSMWQWGECAAAIRALPVEE